VSDDKLEIVPTYIANVSPGRVSAEYSRSLHELRAFDVSSGIDALAGVLEARSGAQISKSRNDLAAAFLRESENNGAEWLLFLDSDMVFPHDVIVRLQMAAHHVNADVVGGLCVMVTGNGAIPTIYQYDHVPGSTGFTRVQLDYVENSLVQVAGTGTACLMIHKRVLERMRDEAGHDYGWFSERVVNVDGSDGSVAHWVSEDLAFCHQVNQLGFRVFVDTTTKIGHDKNGRIWWPSDIGDRTGQRPRLTAVIPMKDKMHLTDRLLEQLVASPYDEIVVVDNGSVEDVTAERLDWWQEHHNVTVLAAPGAGIHHMWNMGAEHLIETHGPRTRIAFLNNDLEVCPDFLAILSHAIDDHPEYFLVSGNYDGRGGETAILEKTDICGNRYDGTGGIAGFAFMLKGEYMVGGYRFPQDMTWWYGDNDLVLSLLHTRVRSGSNGYRSGIVLAATCQHVDVTGKGPGGATVDCDWFGDRERAEILRLDTESFRRKWSPFVEEIRSGAHGPADAS